MVEHGAEACNYLPAVDVEMNTVDGYAMSSWERGYGDFEMRPDFETLRPMPWRDGTALCLADLAWSDGAPVVASPRQILRAQLDRLRVPGADVNPYLALAARTRSTRGSSIACNRATRRWRCGSWPITCAAPSTCSPVCCLEGPSENP